MPLSHLTVIDLAPRILSSILDDGGAALVQKHLEKNGVAFRLGVSAKKFTANTAELTNGEKLDFDVLVTAVGVPFAVSSARLGPDRAATGACRNASSATTVTVTVTGTPLSLITGFAPTVTHTANVEVERLTGP